MSNKLKKAQGLSLTFKEEFDLSKLFISSYSDNKININNINYKSLLIKNICINKILSLFR